MKLTENSNREMLGRMLFDAMCQASKELGHSEFDAPFEEIRKSERDGCIKTAELFANKLCPAYAELVEALKLAKQLLDEKCWGGCDRGRYSKIDDADRYPVMDAIDTALAKAEAVTKQE